MRFRLRTLLIVLAIGPPLLAWIVPPAWKWLTAERQPPLVITVAKGQYDWGFIEQSVP